jgi:hypothetical protein
LLTSRYGKIFHFVICAVDISMTQMVTSSNINLLNSLKIVVKHKHITKNKVQFFKKYYEKLSKKIKQLPKQF